jgi:hypothetical protein
MLCYFELYSVTIAGNRIWNNRKILIEIAKLRNLEIVGKPALGGKTHYSLPDKGISSSVKSVCGKEFHGLD